MIFSQSYTVIDSHLVKDKRGLTNISHSDYANDPNMPQSVYCRKHGDFKPNHYDCDQWTKVTDSHDF